MREMHIWEFPKHFRVLCTDSFLKDSQSVFLNNTGIQRAYLTGNLFMPVRTFKKLARELVSSGVYASFWKIEREILAYKARSTSKPIWEPVLPLKYTPAIAELYAHLIADGGVSNDSIPHYVNSSPALIRRFSYLLRKALGQVHQVVYWNKRGAWDLRFSNTGWEVLRWACGSDANSKTARISPEFLKPGLREAVLRAFIDDEGSVDLNNRVFLGLANLELLQQLYRAAVAVIGATHLTPIRKKPREEYFYFYIRSTGITKIAGLQLQDPHKKRIINFLLNSNHSPGIHRKPGEMRRLLIELLSRSEGATTRELSRQLKVRPSNVLAPLHELSGDGIVKSEFNGNNLYWSISNRSERD